MMGAINGADDGNGPGTHGLALFFVGVRIVQIFIIFCCFTFECALLTFSYIMTMHHPTCKSHIILFV